MKKKILSIALVLMVLLSSISLMGCSEDEDTSPIRLYGENSSATYHAEKYVLAAPSVSKLYFIFYLISDKEISSVKDFKFYDNSGEVDLNIENLQIDTFIIHGDKGKNSKDYKYYVSMNLTMYDITEIAVNKIIVGLRDGDHTFNVNLCFKYEPYDSETEPYYIAARVNRQEADKALISCLIKIPYTFSATIKDVKLRSKDIPLSGILISERISSVEETTPVPLTEKYVLENHKEYKLYFYVNNEDVDYYLSSSIDIDVIVNGSIETTWFSDRLGGGDILDKGVRDSDESVFS